MGKTKFDKSYKSEIRSISGKKGALVKQIKQTPPTTDNLKELLKKTEQFAKSKEQQFKNIAEKYYPKADEQVFGDLKNLLNSMTDLIVYEQNLDWSAVELKGKAQRSIEDIFAEYLLDKSEQGEQRRRGYLEYLNSRKSEIDSLIEQIQARVYGTSPDDTDQNHRNELNGMLDGLLKRLMMIVGGYNG